jgi:hypothetical protein
MVMAQEQFGTFVAQQVVSDAALVKTLGLKAE